MGKLKSAFISYSTDAKVRADQVVGFLTPLGVDTYAFKRDMGQGANVPKVVRDAIKAREAVILVLSAQARESTFVANELGFAEGRGKKIFVYKTAHNLTLPDYVNTDSVQVLEKLDDLNDHFVQPEA